MRGRRAVLGLWSLVALSGAVAPLQAEESPSQPLERSVEFLWLDGSDLWMDTFTVRLSPGEPRVGDAAVVRVRIRRTANGKGRAAPAPSKAVATIRGPSGGHADYELSSPGASFSFGHTFSRAGTYTISVVTTYGESETYTVALRVEVRRAAPVRP